MNEQELTHLANKYGISIHTDAQEFGNSIQFKKSFTTLPTMQQYNTYNVYKNGKVLAEKISFEKLEEMKEKDRAIIIETIFDNEQYEETKAERMNTRQELSNLFKYGLAYICEVLDNPKQDLLYNKAREISHSSDYNEIAGAYSDLCNLIK